jgi:hypothetical protein
MKIKELPTGSNISLYKVRIPSSVKQLAKEPIKEGYIVGMFNNGGGWFMSADPPGGNRILIPSYGNNEEIPDWEIDRIVVVVKPEHFRDAPNGYHNWDRKGSVCSCVLEVAAMDMFKYAEIETGAHMLRINKDLYNIPCYDMWGGESSKYPISLINELSDRAKISLDGIPTVEVILTRMEPVK